MRFSKRIIKNIHTLKKLKSCKDSSKTESILKSADKDLVGALIEVAANILHNRKVKINTAQKKRLCKHVGDIRKLSKCRHYKSGKKIIVQKGSGFISLLLAPLFSTAVSFIANLLRK